MDRLAKGGEHVKDLYSTKDAADYLKRQYGMKLHPRTVARMVDRGEIVAARTLGGQRLIRASELDKFARRAD